MQLPRLEIQQQSIKMALQSEKPQQQIQQPKADVQIEQLPAILEIHTTPSRLEIDQTKCFADVGRKHVFRMNTEFATEAQQAALAAIAQIAQEGDALRTIEQPGTKISMLSEQKANPPLRELAIVFLPRYGSLKMNFTPADLQINWQKRGTQINITPQKVIHEYTPGKVAGSISQWHGIQIDVVGLNVDERL
ncbi:DUF6470 family protein [Rubeoparvulum massiliense]|uniref:DUF6470 family protein n=1 Tax=Rubeoparvulum massiliense TaxID=1631346 RepID=UPI00065E7F25|nr:DUF6470 family protein [Rubeoparvulum massiliense]